MTRRNRNCLGTLVLAIVVAAISILSLEEDGPPMGPKPARPAPTYPVHSSTVAGNPTVGVGGTSCVRCGKGGLLYAEVCEDCEGARPLGSGGP